MPKKLHNPKSQAPAVYIPCWLIQVSVKSLSHGAKIVYGRLSQWATNSCSVFRSVPQLSEELGMCESSVEKYLKELKDVELIGTYHPQAGGVNHFEFYDHVWMHDQIKDQLVYKSDNYDPPYNHTVPSVQSYGTPPYNHTDINKKEIKEIKITHTATIESELFLDSEQQRQALVLRDKCKENQKCKDIYEKLPEDTKKDKSFDDVHEECVTHYATQLKPLLVSPQRLISWMNEDIRYNKTKELNSKNITGQTKKYPKSDDSYWKYVNARKQKGVTYDQHGNTYDPFR